MSAVLLGLYIGGYVVALKLIYHAAIQAVVGDLDLESFDRVMGMFVGMLLGLLWPLVLLGWVLYRTVVSR